MKKKAIIAGIAALTLTASISGLIVSAENEATVPEDNSAYEVQLPEVAESSEDAALSFDGTSYTSGDFTYELDSTSTYATITAYNGTSGDVVVPDMVNGVPVKKLKDELFKGDTKITSVRFDCTQLESISYRCFTGCTNLVSVKVPMGVTVIHAEAFANCKNLVNVNIPNGVTTIYGHAFQNCTALPTIIIPSTCTQIISSGYYHDGGAFEGCTLLSEVLFAGGGTEDARIETNAFKGTAITTLHLPENYKNIGTSVFSNCKKLTTVDSLGGLTGIPTDTFAGCSALESVNIHEGIKTIGATSFSGCTSLKSVTIPSTCTSIISGGYYHDSGAFEGCSSLTEVVFKSGIDDASIESEAFRGTAITSVSLPTNYKTIGTSVFANCKNLKNVTSLGGISTVPTDTFAGCSALESVILHEGIKTIGATSFSGCTSLKSITIPSTCTSIISGGYYHDSGAFEGCSSLAEIIFKPGTEAAKIEGEAFRGTAVTTLTIPANYTNIGYGVFTNCKNLTLVYFENGTNNVTLGDNVFSGCTALRHAVLSKSVKSIGDNAFSSCKLATVVSCDETTFQTNTFTGVKANVKYNTFNGRANVTAIQTEAEKVHIPCIISGYPTSAQMPSSFVGTAVVDHLYFGNNCYLCPATIRPKPIATPGSEKITLSWDTINSASKYAVYNYYNGNFELVAEVEESSYTMSNLNAGETYGFALSAFNNGKWTKLNPEDVVYATPEGSAINAFVDRLYTIILGRGAEPAGLADWTNRLTSGTATSAEIVYGIAGSQEFQEKNYANDVIVEKMYNAMLGRGSDPAGKENWVKQLDAGMSFNAIINGFSGSKEFTEVCAGYGILPGNISQIEPRDINAGLTAFVSRMYTKALGRGYDVNGLNDWTGSYLNGTATTADIAYGFIFSKEFTEKNYTDEQYVDILYSTFFDRAPDEGGKQNWLNDLANGKSREHVLNGFLGSKEFLDLAASFGV